MQFFDQPLNFVRKIRRGKHIVLFYEEPEYARMILFEFLKNGLDNKERCIYISEENTETVKQEMSDTGINIDQFMKNELLFLHQVPNLAGSSNFFPDAMEKISQLALHPWINNHPDRVVLRCIFKVATQEQLRSSLEWERYYRAKELKGLLGTMICTYPVDNIIPTISDSGGLYAKWMSNLLELYDGVIFARRFWKGVAFILE